MMKYVHGGVMKKGFTLAEILLTLGIIGIVAALTMSILIPKINDKVFENQRKAVTNKLVRAIFLMHDNGVFEEADSTESFALELQKYLKIVKICEQHNLSHCFPQKIHNYDIKDGLISISLRNQKDFITENLDVIPILAKRDSEPSEYNKLGLRMADGAGMLVKYIPDCLPPVSNLSSSQEYFKVAQYYSKQNPSAVPPITRESRVCVGAMIDVNGDKKPNKLGKDIYLFQSFLQLLN